VFKKPWVSSTLQAKVACCLVNNVYFLKDETDCIVERRKETSILQSNLNSYSTLQSVTGDLAKIIFQMDPSFIRLLYSHSNVIIVIRDLSIDSITGSFHIKSSKYFKIVTIIRRISRAMKRQNGWLLSLTHLCNLV
jgi:hypothetical protein